MLARVTEQHRTEEEVDAPDDPEDHAENKCPCVQKDEEQEELSAKTEGQHLLQTDRVCLALGLGVEAFDLLVGTSRPGDNRDEHDGEGEKPVRENETGHVDEGELAQRHSSQRPEVIADLGEGLTCVLSEPGLDVVLVDDRQDLHHELVDGRDGLGGRG